MPTLSIVPPMPKAVRHFEPFARYVESLGWRAEFVPLNWSGPQPNFGSTALFPEIEAATAGKIVMGFSLGGLYSHLGALRAKHLILGSISPFFLEDDDEPQRWMISYKAGNPKTPADILVGGLEDAQMHRRAESLRDFYSHHTYTNVPDAEHDLMHPNYLAAMGAALARL